MRSLPAFAAGILVGFLLAWAGGPAVRLVALHWPAAERATAPDGLRAGLQSLRGRLAAVLRPSDSPSSAMTWRRPVSRSVRMARSDTVIALPVPGLPGLPAHGDGLAAADPPPAFDLAGPESVGAAAPPRTAPDCEPAPAARPAGEKQQAARPETAAQVYARALGDYGKGRHAQARQGFAAFMGAFPGHSLLPNALYWTGETWYAQARYDRAAEFFARVVRDHPRHAKSPDALLKLAYSALRRGQPGQAGAYLRQLEADYPDSPASRLGRQAQGRLHGRNGTAAVVPARG